VCRLICTVTIPTALALGSFSQAPTHVYPDPQNAYRRGSSLPRPKDQQIRWDADDLWLFVGSLLKSRGKVRAVSRSDGEGPDERLEQRCEPSDLLEVGAGESLELSRAFDGQSQAHDPMVARVPHTGHQTG
jgi:hypothetical protein